MKYSNLTRVYIKEPIVKGKRITITGDELHYLKSVIRLKISSSFRLFNDTDGEFLVEIVEVSKSSLVAKIVSFLRKSQKSQELTLAMCIIKPDRMLEAIKGAVQLGATQIIPIISERVQYKQVAKSRILKSIIQSTAQSERFHPPSLSEEITLSDFCKDNHFKQIIFANELESENNKILNISKRESKVAILIGPEGGFSNSEIDMLKSYDNVSSVSLGLNVLRAEVAAISAISLIKMMQE